MMKEKLLHELPWLNLSVTDKIISALCKPNRPYYCIRGPKGSGKTRIMYEVAAILNKDECYHVCCIEASNAHLFTDLLKKLGEYSEVVTDDQAQILMIVQLEKLIAANKHVVIFIDSAENLGIERLQFFFDLNKKISCLTTDNKLLLTMVVLVGTAPIDSATRKILSGAFCLTISPMSITQAKQLVIHACDFFKKKHQFSAADISRLHGMSYGYAGRLLNLLELFPSKKIRMNNYLWGVILLFIVSILALLLNLFITKDDQSEFLTGSASEKASISSALDSSSDPRPDDELLDGPRIIIDGFNENNQVILFDRIHKQLAYASAVMEHDLQSQLDNQLVMGRLPIFSHDENIRTDLEQTDIPQAERHEPIISTHVLTDIKTGLINTGEIEESLDNHVADHQDQVDVSIDTLKSNEPIIDKESVYYVIILTTSNTQQDVLFQLKGRSVPGVPKTARILLDGKRQWVSYIGPYVSQSQAEMGLKRLPESLQRLRLRVLSSSVLK